MFIRMYTPRHTQDDMNHSIGDRKKQKKMACEIMKAEKTQYNAKPKNKQENLIMELDRCQFTRLLDVRYANPDPSCCAQSLYGIRAHAHIAMDGILRTLRTSQAEALA